MPGSKTDTVPTLQAQYFDGQQARASTVSLRIARSGGQAMLVITGEEWQLQVPAKSIVWPESNQQPMRLALLPQGGQLLCSDVQAWDSWYHNSGMQRSLAERMQGSWRWVGVGAMILGLLASVTYLWGIPLLADAVVTLAPAELEQEISAQTLAALDSTMLKPSRLESDIQQRISQDFAALTGQASDAAKVRWKLSFRSSTSGPNALALPDGTIILTDEMVNLVDGDVSIISAVLSHELGHVYHHHGLRMLVQATTVGTLSALAFGDFSSIIAILPTLLGQAHYSREAEHQADVFAVTVLQQGGRSPLLMVQMFDALAKAYPEHDKQADWLGMAFSSHPSDAKRIDFFRQSAL